MAQLALLLRPTGLLAASGSLYVALDNAEKFGKMPQYFMVTYQREGLCGCGPLDIVEVLGIFESFGDAISI